MGQYFTGRTFQCTGMIENVSFSLLYCQVYVSYKDNVRILNPGVQISFLILVQFAIESFIAINRVITIISGI